MKRIILFSVFAFFYLPACSDPEYDLSIKECYIQWYGETDMCGFFFDIDSKIYKAENDSILDSSYKIQGNTKILLAYIDLKREYVYYCGFDGGRHASPGIKIIDIKKLSE